MAVGVQDFIPVVAHVLVQEITPLIAAAECGATEVMKVGSTAVKQAETFSHPEFDHKPQKSQ
eukprot:4269329-Amphidinium_carterae.2